MTEISALAVFCGSRKGADPAHMDQARALGQEMARRGIRLIYGGGGIGLMGEIAHSVLDAGGEVTGVIPEFLMRLEVGDPGCTTLEVVDSMHTRKARMAELADGFVALPGGLGTLDETFEIITWKQLRLHDKPIVIADFGGYWSGLTRLVEETVAGGFAHPSVQDLYSVASSVDGLFEALANAPEVDDRVLTSHL
ncbi:MAG: TIGR00730 family Rossman fold protein [Magnetovibrionaceae bacterium]